MTADECIARARIIFPAIPLSSAASPDGLDLLNELVGELLFDVELSSQEVDVNMTANTAHYTVTTPMRVWSARYVRSATTGDFKHLLPTSQDEMDSREQQHLRLSAGEPTYWWMLPTSAGTQELWLSATPATTTSGGYPKVTLRHSKYVALAAGDSLPVGLPSYEAFVLGLAAKWASYVGDPKEADLQQRFEVRKKQLETFRHSVNARIKPTVRPGVRWRARKV